MILWPIILGSTFFVAYLLFLYIRKMYREYDRKETIKENITEYRAQIKMALDYFRVTYEHNVYNNIKTNSDFCLKIIYNKNIEDQLKYMEKLYNTLYETGFRLKTRFDDVNYILAPMKNLREELFVEQMDFIKENSEGLI